METTDQYVKRVINENEHSKMPNQVVIVLSGETPAATLSRLEEIVAQFKSHGKPIQGHVCSYKTQTSIITPIWNGKEY